LALAAGGACGSHHAGPAKDGGAAGAGVGGGAAGTAGAAGAGVGGGAAGAANDGDASAPPDASDAGGAASSDAADGAAEARLVPWQLESAGTAPLVLGILDKQEKAVCRFVTDRTGQLRCLPPPPTSLADTGTFTDSGCTKRVYAIGRGDLAKLPAGKPLALPLIHRGCGPVPYDVGTLSEIPADTPVFLGPACTPFDLFPQDGLAFAVATTGPLERSVPGTIVDGPLVAGRLRVAQVATADGARFDDHAVDTRYSKPCSLTAKATACTPVMLPADSKVFGDEQCMAPLADGSRVCDAALIASNATLPFRAIGDPWTSAVFSKSPGPCHALSASTDSTFFNVGPALDGDPIMPVDWPQKGSGRLRLRELEGKTGASVPVGNVLSWSASNAVAPRYFDSVAGVDCNPVWTPEGLVRCVPASTMTSYPGFFSDATCKTPGYLCYAADCSTQPMMDLDADRAVGLHALAIHRLVNVSAIYTLSGTTCTAFPIAGTSFMFGPEAALPWDTFPPFTEVNAP
jgi:hypothetical protein